MDTRLPDSPSVARNRDPILEVLRTHFSAVSRVLEIGSGTGQHAIHFAASLAHLEWQCSDRADALSGISAWLRQAQLPNTPAPIELDVGGDWPETRHDAVFSANTLHIMSWREVETFFRRLPAVLAAGGRLVIYGPFNYHGRFTSSSNAEFDQWLKARATHQGIRDFEAVCALAQEAGLTLLEDRAMPAHNRCLVWAS